MLQILVTVIIRTYNREKIVGNAIESVLAQTHDHFELIILDDCSTDNTYDVCKQYEKKDPRIRYIRHKKNSGTGKGFNTANSLARGKYVAYLDDDDTWRPNKLAKQLKKFESCSDKVGFITGGVQHWNGDTGRKLGKWIPSQRGFVYWETLGRSGHVFGPPSAIMIRKTVLEEIGKFREDMPRGCCQQYFRRVAKNYNFDYIEDIVLDYFYHKQAITTITSIKDFEKSAISIKIKIKSTEKDLQKVPFVYAQNLKELGHFLCLCGRMNEGSYNFRKAFFLKKTSLALLVLWYGSKTNSLKFYNVSYQISRIIDRMEKSLFNKGGRK